MILFTSCSVFDNKGYDFSETILKIGYSSEIYLFEYDVGIAQDIMDALDINYTTEAIEPKDLVKSLKNGDIDCILRFNRSGKTEGIRVTETYLKSEYVVIVKKGSLSGSSVSFKGKSLGISDEYEIKKYAYSDFDLKTEFAEYLIYDDLEKAFYDLENDLVDALLVDKFLLQLFEKRGFEIAVDDLQSIEYAMAYREQDKSMFKEIGKYIK